MVFVVAACDRVLGLGAAIPGDGPGPDAPPIAPNLRIGYEIWYADRADPLQPFTNFARLDGTPRVDTTDVQSPFMSEDCGRLYFTALDQVLYLNLIY